MANAFPIIDADAHVVETERTWDYLPAAEQKFRPKLYSAPADPTRRRFQGFLESGRYSIATSFSPSN